MRLKKLDKPSSVVQVILFNPQPITRQRIKELRDHAGSWDKLRKKLGYKSDSTIRAAHYYPNRITTPLANRVRNYELAIEAELGHYVTVEFGNGIKRVAPHLRITHKFVVCKGHRLPCSWVDKNGFCGDECRAKAKEKKR